MTQEEMVDLLGLRLEDPDYRSFSTATRYKVLNVAQLQIVNLVDNAMLTELEAIDNTDADASGVILLSDLTDMPIRNGVFAVYNESQSVAKFVNLIEFKDIKRLENTYMSATTSNPIAYIFKNQIYLKPESADTCNVYYLRKPLDIADGQDCELDESLHDVVVSLAESQLWRMDGKADRATSALESGMAFIKALNDRYSVEKPQGVGTYGRTVTTSRTAT